MDYNNKPGGVLFHQDPARKTNPNQPDFKGYVIIDPAHVQAINYAVSVGQPIKLEIAGWKKTSNAGNPFMSLKLSLPQAQQQAQQPRPNPPRDRDDPFNDEMPF